MKLARSGRPTLGCQVASRRGGVGLAGLSAAGNLHPASSACVVGGIVHEDVPACVGKPSVEDRPVPAGSLTVEPSDDAHL